jgi:hypothetical protein
MNNTSKAKSKDPGALQSARPEAAGDNRGQSPLKIVGVSLVWQR